MSTTLLAACRSRQAPTSGTATSPAPSAAAMLLSEVETTKKEPSPLHLIQATPAPTTQNPEPSPTLLTPPSPPTPTTLPAPSTPVVIQHTVQPGEALLGLARHYGVSMASIQLSNDMGDSIDLMAGQTLFIPGEPQWLEENQFWVLHIIQASETLVGIASAHDLTIDEILRVNAIADPALLHIGQPLILPLIQLVQTPSPTATPVAVAAAPAAINAPPAAEAKTPQTTTEAPAPSPTASPLSPPPPPEPPAGKTDWPGYILARINQARAENGLNTLSIAPELTQAAQAHAQDCAGRGWGSHVGSDGAVLKTRLERAGYFGANWGENWVQALNSERAFDWWYGEIPPNDPHRRNILSAYYTEVGIGIAETDWGYIFVTDFGQR